MIRRLLWIVAALTLIDVSVNLATMYPDAPPSDGGIGSLQRYFNYGLSIESKVRWMVADTDSEAAPLVKAGWLLAPEEPASEAAQADVVIYGMSFSARIGTALASISPLEVRSRGGPAAPVNRSFADYLLNRNAERAPVVVLAVLASSVPYTNTLSHMTWNFEAPSPHFYPRFSVSPGGRLERYDAGVESLSELRRVLRDPADWRALKEQLAAHDAFYDARSFDADWLDHSTVGRLLRRAWAQRRHRETVARFHDESGFLDEDGTLTVLRSILVEFADLVRSDGATPVVLLIHDQGFSDHLYQAVHGTLEQQGIAFVSTHEVAGPQEYDKFLPDGHFRPDIDVHLAQRLLEAVRQSPDL